jgi:hypothetical protein
MSLVSKILGRGHGKEASGGVSEDDRLAADRARQLSVPAMQSNEDQEAVRARMEEELAAQRARRQQAAQAD